MVNAVPDETFSKAAVSVRVNIENRSQQNVSGLTLEAEITGYNKQGELVEINQTQKIPSLSILNEVVAEIKTTINQPKLWSAETPDLYHITLKLKNGKNEILEKAECYFGVRKIEVRGEVFYVNGQPVKLKGINATNNTRVPASM